MKNNSIRGSASPAISVILSGLGGTLSVRTIFGCKSMSVLDRIVNLGMAYATGKVLAREFAGEGAAMSFERAFIAELLEQLNLSLIALCEQAQKEPGWGAPRREAEYAAVPARTRRKRVKRAKGRKRGRPFNSASLNGGIVPRPPEGGGGARPRHTSEIQAVLPSSMAKVTAVGAVAPNAPASA